MGKLAKDLLSAQSLNTTRVHNLCGVGKFVSTLDDDDRKAFKAAMDNPDIQVIAIARTLENNGITLGYDLIARHRRRAIGSGCRCPADL